MKRLLGGLVVLLFSLHAIAEEDWYGTLGAGMMIVHGIKNSSTEQKIIDNSHVVSDASLDNKSTYESFMIGHCVNYHICVEGGYLWGAHFSKIITVKSIKGGTVDIGGIPVTLADQSVGLTLQREADVSAVQLSVLGKYAVTDWLDIFGRLGAYRYQIKTIAKIPLPQNLFLGEVEDMRGTTGMASLGAYVKFSKEKKGLTIRLEGQTAGKVSIGSLSLVYQF